MLRNTSIHKYWPGDKYYIGNLQEAHLELRRLLYVLIFLIAYASDIQISGFCEDLDFISRVLFYRFWKLSMN